ncbi:tRNA (5-methylaminomethyl-2-thiouridine)(34)-methyltransferase MnmD [Massilibacteroides sp.]|uniref:tRNA (5-methylaminomethyl-2-thiouridine)(34)-methyltransferase MnmD n=1 Tax=Massilibacteroides sp. TaxID=2034766 RepID=UPI00260B47F7|nr:tRNA (5-methylaminomethyl-2-thiouridine)(34)-methyltransferase MnmD [Massilibacteroides sp.]MDD4513943.1 tRNA (5-methylaminomethyl-2-thiouridine)(34)-methyltransferase MnmD [Massilibacteroides sp.]
MNRGDNIRRELQITADGSHTLFLPEMNEHYHSINGAVQESLHVFIEAGLRHLKKNSIRILEIGFGTGLNAFLTLQETFANSSLKIDYYSIERFPLDEELVKQLNYAESQTDLFLSLHDAKWGVLEEITDRFSLFKIQGDSNSCELPDGIDLVYFDAFAPDKQPEMWNQDIFNKLYSKTNGNGLLATYCAKGTVRRMIKEAGYSVERIPGPPGKREMLRAQKIS